MHIFDYKFLKSVRIDPDLLNRAANIAKLSGRIQGYCGDSGPVAEALSRHASVMSVRDSGILDGISVNPDRLMGIVSGSVSPRGYDEIELAGYGRVLGRIKRDYPKIVLGKQTILSLHAMLMSDSGRNESGFKTRDTVVEDRDGHLTRIYPTVPAKRAEESIDQLVGAFWEARDDESINSMLLIPCFVMDFLRISPFTEGNGRMAMLLTDLLLYQEGYGVCRYASMESKICASRTDYHQVLEESYKGWMENSCDYTPFIHYFLGELFLCLRDLNRMAGEESGRKKKSGSLETYLRMNTMPFSKSDLMALFPEISKKTVERTLVRMCDEGIIEMMGAGRAVRYMPKA